MANRTEEYDALSSRRALEALRNGVPNTEAVKVLGCNQPEAEKRFNDLLDKAATVDNPTDGTLGMLVSGDFGSGKSHLLTHLEHQALSKGFVCSKVVLSKETPLYDLGKVFKSAMENGRMPHRSGQLIEELGQRLNPKYPSYADFFHWANCAGSSDRIHRIFPASLMVYERSGDLETCAKIESFWAGDRILIRDVKNGLKQIGQQKNFSFKAPRVSELPPQRLRFATELIKGAGYKGWVVLLDEIELIGSYSILQRGRSYAELAGWMGQAFGEDCPGLVVVGTVTEDFALEIISPDGVKKDRDYVKPKLDSSKRYSHVTDRAEIGMNFLEGQCMSLKTPTDGEVQHTVDKLREIYSNAYDWNAPALQGETRGAGFEARMRYKVRAAINEWDLRRLYPDYRPETEVDEFRHTYEENVDLERESKDDGE